MARRNGLSLTVLFFDLNGLKQVNDSSGHEVGSRLLVHAADLLRSNFRSNDVVARVGGDEFAVVTHSSKDELIAALNHRADAMMYARKRRKKAERKAAGTAAAGTEAYQPMATGVLAAYVAQKDRR
jgi:diguanylate cyclase (GGDEF)-like protein